LEQCDQKQSVLVAFAQCALISLQAHAVAQSVVQAQHCPLQGPPDNFVAYSIRLPTHYIHRFAMTAQPDVVPVLYKRAWTLLIWRR